MRCFKNKLMFVLFTLAAGCGAQIHSVPVTAAPLPAERVEELRAGLKGTWHLYEEMPNGGTERKKVEGSTFMVFSDDGTMAYSYSKFNVLVLTEIEANRTYQWALDGANLSFTPAFLVMRIDGLTADTLDVFVYDFGYHWYFQRVPQ
jgi:hypothetical protein